MPHKIIDRQMTNNEAVSCTNVSSALKGKASIKLCCFWHSGYLMEMPTSMAVTNYARFYQTMVAPK